MPHQPNASYSGSLISCVVLTLGGVFVGMLVGSVIAIAAEDNPNISNYAHAVCATIGGLIGFAIGVSEIRSVAVKNAAQSVRLREAQTLEVRRVSMAMSFCP